MQRLCFKSRKGGRTVQLVRHVYCSAARRSRTLTLGSLPLDADPDGFQHELHLRDGVILSEDEYRQIAAYLVEEGDAAAAQRRKEAASRVEARVRAEISLARKDALQFARQALDAATRALPELTAATAAMGKDVWQVMRPDYLAVHAAWQQLVKAAQSCGVAKRTTRQSAGKPAATPRLP